MNERIHELCKRSVMQNGATLQQFVVLEEIMELLVADTNFVEEVADVRICLSMLEVIYGITKEEIRSKDTYCTLHFDTPVDGLNDYLHILHKAITKTIRGKYKRGDLIQAIANMFYIISYIASRNQFQKEYVKQLQFKLDRLEDRLKKGEK